MKKDLTEIAFVLDRSGSMASMAEHAIAGFNQFLAEQAAQPGTARLTLALFDDEYLLPANALPISEVLPLDTTTFIPRGSTALLDAIGKTIDDLGARLTSTPERDRPGQVIIAILTDGEENASTKYTWDDIAKRIRHQTDAYKWEFLFLGANQDAIATASKLNISQHNSASYCADPIGTRTSSGSMSKKVLAMRRRAAGEASHEDLHTLAQSMQDTVNENDAEEREKK